MNRILLVDNEPEWLDLMCRALPGYDVDKADSYAGALCLIKDGLTYDVAVVDLNLIDSGDGLGREFLTLLRKESPLTRRIALTAFPPGAVRKEIFVLYDVDELLLKPHMSLSLLREVVQTALARSAEDIDPDLRAFRSELWEGFRGWRDGVEGRLTQRQRTLEKDREGIRHMPDRSRRAASTLAALDAQIAELVVKKAALRRACSRLEVLLRDMAGSADASRVSDEMANLKEEFGP